MSGLTADVTAALRERFCAPEFAFFEEVGDAGSGSRVYADGVAINMWASRGYAITGFEVKVSRSDWLRELKQPDKAEPIIRKCDYFYLVAPDEIYQADEVPVSWGIIGWKDGKLREKRKAPKLEAAPISRSFVAQMFRRGHEIEKRDLTALIDKALRDERASVSKRVEDVSVERPLDGLSASTRCLSRERRRAFNPSAQKLASRFCCQFAIQRLGIDGGEQRQQRARRRRPKALVEIDDRRLLPANGRKCAGQRTVASQGSIDTTALRWREAAGCMPWQ